MKYLFSALLSKASQLRTRLGTWSVCLLSAAALVWVFHDIEWNTLAEQLQQVSWPWVCAIVAFDVLSFYVQGVRWRLLLRPCGHIHSAKTTQAIYVGLFSSELLPLRAGEVVRGVLVSRWLGRKFREVLPSMAVERLLDALCFSATMGVVALIVPVPGQIRTVALSVLIAAAVGMALFAWNAARGANSDHALSTTAEAPRGRIGVLLQDVTHGLRAIGFSRPFWAAIGFSGLLHIVQALAFFAVMEACGVGLPVLSVIAVFLIVQLGIAIPNAPANVGAYQLFCVLGLTFFGVDKSTAAVVSLLGFAILTLPVLLIGGIATLQAGLSFTDFRSQLREAADSSPAA